MHNQLPTYGLRICPLHWIGAFVLLCMLWIGNSVATQAQDLIQSDSMEMPNDLPVIPEELIEMTAPEPEAVDVGTIVDPPPELMPGLMPSEEAITKQSFQATLTVDIYPIDRPGQVKLSDKRPEQTSRQVYKDVSFIQTHWSAEELCGTSSPYCHCLLEPALFCHRPLYFEDVWLERYGRRCGYCQPVASAAHFFGSAAYLPCHVWRYRWNWCVQTPCPY